jgi:uncharacterized protein (TIGR02231 family)
MVFTSIDTQITAVTVYSDRALVTRQGNITLTGAETALTIANLPNILDPESVRVSGKGTVAVKLQGVTCDRKYRTEPVAERVAQLTAEIERLGADSRRLQAQIGSLNLQSDFVAGLRQNTEETFSRSLARQQIGLEDTLNLLNFIGTKHTEYAYAIEDLQQQQAAIDKQLQALRSQLNQVKNPRSKESLEISVAIACAGAGEFQLEVTYVVARASWKPLYDLRVQSGSKTMQLSYLAEITQTTGEDWSNVSLILSTAKPGLGTIPPKLDPWYIDVPTPPAPVMERRKDRTEEPMMIPAFLKQNYRPAAAAKEEVADFDTLTMEYAAETVVAEVSQQGSVVTFQIGGGGNIPSDNNPHKATILYDNFPCQFTYLAMPRLVSFAYLQAKAKNPAEGATLLPGKANIFRDEMFVGATNLDHIAPGQEFKLNLGIDEGIKLDRELIERQVDKKFLGGNRRITYAYRLTVTNLLDRLVTLELNDQIPHSRNEQIKVKLMKISPQIPLGELGRLTWELNLAAHSKTDIYYQFAIEHPENLQVVGLNV